METIGPLQLRVMQYIWVRGPSTVHEVHAALMAEPGVRRLAYTTILTVMRNLARRSILNQVREGRAHRYRALIDERTYQIDVMSHLCRDVFRCQAHAGCDTTNPTGPGREDRIRSCATLALAQLVAAPTAH